MMINPYLDYDLLFQYACKYGDEILAVAMIEKHLTTIKKLRRRLSNEFKKNHLNVLRREAFEYAFDNGQLRIAKWIFLKRSCLDIWHFKDCQETSNFEIFKYIIEKIYSLEGVEGIKIIGTDVLNMAFRHYSSKSQNGQTYAEGLEIIHYVIQRLLKIFYHDVFVYGNGYETFRQEYDNTWTSMLSKPLKYGFSDIFQLVLEEKDKYQDEKQVKIYFDWDLIFICACKNNYLDIIQLSLDHNSFLPFEDGLEYACRKGYLELTKKLIELSEPNVLNYLADGLNTACKYGQIQIVNFMLEKIIANIEKNGHPERFFNEKLLIDACHGNLEIVKLLMSQMLSYKIPIDWNGIINRLHADYCTINSSIPMIKFIIHQIKINSDFSNQSSKYQIYSLINLFDTIFDVCQNTDVKQLMLKKIKKLHDLDVSCHCHWDWHTAYRNRLLNNICRNSVSDYEYRDLTIIKLLVENGATNMKMCLEQYRKMPLHIQLYLYDYLKKLKLI